MTVKNFQSSNNFDVDETLKSQLKPSLNLDFSKSKQLDSRISFYRNSAGTYYDKNSAVLSEQNLLPNSNSFTTTDYSSNGNLFIYTTVNAAAAPDGTTTANLVVPGNFAAVPSYYSRNFTGSNPRYYVHDGSTQSIFAKANGYTKIALRESQTGAFYASFDLSTGTVLTASNCTATITAYENNWYRISASGTYSGYTRFAVYFLDPSYTSGSVTGTWTPNGTDGWLIWGAQLESRLAVTDYVPTTNSKPFSRYMPILKTVAENKPRFHHNPNTRESLGLLIEEQRTNIFTNSEDFTSLALRSFTINNSITAPDGTLTGTKIITDNGDTQGRAFRGIAGANGNYFTGSVYAKKGEFDAILLSVYQPGYIRVVVNLNDGSVINSNTTSDYYTVTDVGNGWYRISVSTTSTSLYWNIGIGNVGDSIGGSEISTPGNGYDGLYIWGAQMEEASFPTSYIKTTGSQATRNADDVRINNSDWYNQNEGTILADFTINHSPTLDSNPTIWVLYDGVFGVADNMQLAFNGTTGRLRLLNYDTSSSAYNGSDNIYPSNVFSAGRIQTVTSFSNDGAGLAYDGNINTTGTYSMRSVPKTELWIGRSGNSSDREINGTMRRLSYFPLKLDNDVIQKLTEDENDD